MLPRHTRCVLSRLRCSGHSLLLSSYLSGIGNKSFLQRLRTPTPGHLSSHSTLSNFGLFAPLSLWRLSVFLRFLFQALVTLPASGAPWSSAMPPSLGREAFLGRGGQQQQQQRYQKLLLVHLFVNKYFGSNLIKQYFEITVEDVGARMMLSQIKVFSPPKKGHHLSRCSLLAAICADRDNVDSIQAARANR